MAFLDCSVPVWWDCIHSSEYLSGWSYEVNCKEFVYFARRFLEDRITETNGQNI